MKVSVLIATRNRPDQLRTCLRSISRQNYPDLEVIVLEDAPAKPMGEALIRSSLSSHIPLRYELFSEQAGVGKSRNHLMRLATGDFAFILDDDAAFIESNAIQEGVDLFLGNEKIGALAFKIVHDAEKKVGMYPFSRLRLLLSPRLRELPGKCSYFYGAGHAIRAPLFKKYRYDEVNSFWYLQDVSLSYQIIAGGYAIFYCPNVAIFHAASPSVLGQSELFHATRNRVIFAGTHLPVPYLASQVIFWSLFFCWRGLVNGEFKQFRGGLREGIASLGKKRSPLSDEALAYLRMNYGRLWY